MAEVTFSPAATKMIGHLPRTQGFRKLGLVRLIFGWFKRLASHFKEHVLVILNHVLKLKYNHPSLNSIDFLFKNSPQSFNMVLLVLREAVLHTHRSLVCPPPLPVLNLEASKAVFASRQRPSRPQLGDYERISCTSRCQQLPEWDVRAITTHPVYTKT